VVDPDVVARRLLALNEALGELARAEAGDERALGTDSMLRAVKWIR
jgi:hypothetical protein